MTDTIKRPHKFEPLKDVRAVFCEYCALTVDTQSKSRNKSDHEIAAKGCPCAPIQQEAVCPCNGLGVLNISGRQLICRGCNGTGVPLQRDEKGNVQKVHIANRQEENDSVDCAKCTGSGYITVTSWSGSPSVCCDRCNGTGKT